MNEEITLQMFINACIIAGLATWFIYSIIDLAFSETKTDNMSNANFIKWIILVSVSVWRIFVSAATWKPKSGIDKEIAEEEKEIAELERQKEKMDKLAELKRRKERLFKDVHDVYEEKPSEYWICPQCRITFKDLEALEKHGEMEHPF